MKGQLHKPGKSALRKETLDHGAYSVEEGLRERDIDLMEYGALSGSQRNGESIPFLITAGSTGTINVGTGTAIAPASDPNYEALVASDPPFGCADIETGGERITISLVDVGTKGLAWSRTIAEAGSGAGTGPFKETEDGLGGWAFTPTSTGAKSIPLDQGDGVYRIWLSYIPQIDPAVFSVHPLTGAKIYTKRLDGYEIYPTMSDVKPGAPDGRYFKIGQVTVAGGVVTAIDQSMMPWAKSRLNRVGIKVDSAKKPATYANGAPGTFLDDHINALGSGVVTPENPHALLLSDCGDYSSRGVDHMRSAHSDGIINTVPGCLACATYGAFPGYTGLGVMVTQLVSGEYVSIDGYLNTKIYPNVDIYLGNVGYVYFSGTDPDGDYNIYLYNDANGKATVGKVLTSGALPSKYALLAKFSWTAGALTFLQDLRVFTTGFIGASNLQAGSVTSAKVHAADAGTSQDITTGNGIKTDHIVDEAITSDKLAPGAVTKDKISMGSIPYPIRWCVQGEATTATKVIQVLSDADQKITRVDLYEDSMSLYGELTIDVKINGTSIFVTKPKILANTLNTNQPGSAPGVRIYTTTAVGQAFTNTPFTNVSYGQINDNANSAQKGDRISLDITQTAVTGDGGGNDILVTLSTE